MNYSSLHITTHGDQSITDSVSMVDGIIGCPHEEGIDYPDGGVCPECTFWKYRDRFSHVITH